MMSRFWRGRKGFTLIELAVVMVVSGLLTAAGFNAYRVYLKDKYSRDSFEKQKMISGSLKLFTTFSGRLPCPSNPTIPIADPGSGLEIPSATCAFLRTAAVGTCMDGVCVAQGRDANNDGTADNILIGGIPYSAIRSGVDPTSTKSKDVMTNQQVLDPWDYQMTYAVSALLTDSLTFNDSNGAIDVVTEGGVSLVDPPQSALYVVVAHGDNHLGAYTADGVPAIPCTTGAVTKDEENCNRDGTFIEGLRSMGAGATYFDDVVMHSAFTMSILWDFVGTTEDIYNKNPGFVGIGTDSPVQQLEVGSTALGVHYNVKATKARQNLLCSQTSIGTGCWSPDFLAAPTTGPQATTGLALTCPPTGTAGMVDVVIGITLDTSVTPNVPKAKCGLVPMVAPSTNQMCTNPGEYVLGFSSTGALECGPPP